MNTSNASEFLCKIAICTTVVCMIICACLVNGHTVTNAERLHYNMSQADTETHHVNDFTLLEMPNGTHDIWLGSTFVETDFDEQTAAELFYTKEEIVVRVDGHRVSIIGGDNGQF